MVVKVEVDERN